VALREPMTRFIGLSFRGWSPNAIFKLQKN
jgi:hypothetical protein